MKQRKYDIQRLRFPLPGGRAFTEEGQIVTHVKDGATQGAVDMHTGRFVASSRFPATVADVTNSQGWRDWKKGAYHTPYDVPPYESPTFPGKSPHEGSVYSWQHIETFATNASFPAAAGVLERDGTDILVQCPGVVYRYNAGGDLIDTLSHGSPQYYFCYDEYGNYYVTLNHYNVAKYNSSGTLQWTIGKQDGGGAYVYGTGDGEFSGVFDLAYSYETGNLYVADLNNGRIQYFDLSGAYIGQWNTGGKPYQIEIIPGGNVYVLNQYFPPGDTANIVAYTSGGAEIYEYATDDFQIGRFSLSSGLERTMLYCYKARSPNKVILEYNIDRELVDTITDVTINLTNTFGIIYFVEDGIPTILYGSSSKNIEKMQYIAEETEE